MSERKFYLLTYLLEIRAKYTEIGNFRSFFALLPLKTPKIEILKNEKNCWTYHHFTYVYLKTQSYDVWFLRYGVRQTKFFVIMDHFLPFYPYRPRKSKFWKTEENTPRDIIILHKCTKIMIICCTVPWIWHITDIIIFHFGQFFAPFST